MAEKDTERERKRCIDGFLYLAITIVIATARNVIGKIEAEAVPPFIIVMQGFGQHRPV